MTIFCESRKNIMSVKILNSKFNVYILFMFTPYISISRKKLEWLLFFNKIIKTTRTKKKFQNLKLKSLRGI